MLTTLNKINKLVNSKSLMILDYLGSFGLLGFAYYKYSIQESYLFWAIAGGVSLLFAILRPTRLLQAKDDKKKNSEAEK